MIDLRTPEKIRVLRVEVMDLLDVRRSKANLGERSFAAEPLMQASDCLDAKAVAHLRS
jgi:hypothetical protein